MERLIVASTFLLYPLAATLFSTVAGSGDTLTLNQTLADDGGALVSAGGSFALGFFSPTGSTNRYIGIWYNKISVPTVVWVANRGQPVMDRQGKLSILANGTLVITDSSPTVVRLSSSSVAVSNPVAQLLDDGNFVVREAGSTEASDPNSFAWQSFDFPTDTVLPGMKLGWNLTSQMNRNFTAWFSDNDPSPGNYVSGIDMHGEPQLFLWSGRQQYWRGGPWNGVRFSGIPEMKSDIMYFKFVMDPEEVFWSYYLRDPSTITRLITKNSGLLQHLVWIEGSKSWNVFGVAPKDECDSKISPCGPNGVCYHTGEPMCTCLPGFRPKNSRNWNLSDWNDGCVRKTALDCRTDEFSKQASLKLPDTSRSTVDWSMSLEKCKALCSANCSCTAYASANISGSGSGCIMWTTELTDVRLFDNNLGQDIYVRLAASDIGTEPDISHHSPVVLIIILVSVVTIFLVAGCACWVWYTKRKRTSLDEDEVKDMDLPLYDLATIIDATGNFSTDNKLGQGGFGPVYKGKLADETEVAVKRLSKTSAQGVDEFKNEALLIAKLQHRNLVRLLGCCIQGGERMLMYEYMPNGSLDTFLFDKTKSVLLDWPTRYNIIVSISRGLLYLHQDSRFRIIHRDLKAGNILLDKDMNPKISDFGMARIFGGEDSEVNTRRVVGTYGYMSPEYAMDGVFSVKSDVFSLGVLILEIITGKKNRGVYHSAFHINLLGHVWSLWKEGKVLELVDKSLGHSFPVPEILTCIKVALLCVQERPIDRPTMSAVVKMLGNDNTLLPEPKQSGFVASKDSLAEIDLSTRTKQLSINNMSITLQEGR